MGDSWFYRWRSPLENIAHNVAAINKLDRVHLHMGDLTDLASLHNIFKLVKFDYVFHLAAQSYPHTSFTSPADTYSVNIIGTENVLMCVEFFQTL